MVRQHGDKHEIPSEHRRNQYVIPLLVLFCSALIA